MVVEMSVSCAMGLESWILVREGPFGPDSRWKKLGRRKAAQLSFSSNIDVHNEYEANVAVVHARRGSTTARRRPGRAHNNERRRRRRDGGLGVRSHHARLHDRHSTIAASASRKGANRKAISGRTDCGRTFLMRHLDRVRRAQRARNTTPAHRDLC